MKAVKRIGVFETNSSSTHTLMLVPADGMGDKGDRYGVVATKYNKLLMACGCGYELFPDAKIMDEGYKYSDELRETEEQFAAGEWIYGKLTYQTTMALLVGEYCKLTGEDYDKTLAEVLRINDSGRACHMKFFSEGALYDEDYDYELILDLFRGTRSEVIAAIDAYFDDKYVLLYREYYGGVAWDDDD